MVRAVWPAHMLTRALRVSFVICCIQFFLSRDRWGGWLLNPDWWAVGGRTLAVHAPTQENSTAPAQGSVSPFTPGSGLTCLLFRAGGRGPKVSLAKESSGLAQLQRAGPSVGAFSSSPWADDTALSMAPLMVTVDDHLDRI